MTQPLGADLGKLAAPGRQSPFDEVRFALLDAIIAAKQQVPMDQAAWEEAFNQAVRSIRMRVLGEAEQSIRAAAAHSRFPSRRLQEALPNAAAAERLLNQLVAEGMPLERQEGLGSDPVSQRARAVALETSWEGVVRVAQSEAARWRAAAAGIAEWRRPLTALWIGSGIVLVAVLLLAAWLSGAVPAPEWFRPVNAFWWRLWP